METIEKAKNAAASIMASAQVRLPPYHPTPTRHPPTPPCRPAALPPCRPAALPRVSHRAARASRLSPPAPNRQPPTAPHPTAPHRTTPTPALPHQHQRYRANTSPAAPTPTLPFVAGRAQGPAIHLGSDRGGGGGCPEGCRGRHGVRPRAGDTPPLHMFVMPITGVCSMGRSPRSAGGGSSGVFVFRKLKICSSKYSLAIASA